MTITLSFRQRHLSLALIAALGIAAGAALSPAQQAAPAPGMGGVDWPQFRGPNRNGVSTEKGWSTTWPEGGPKVLWSAQLGSGASTVIVRGNRLYSMGNKGDQDTVWCLDVATGKEIWKYSYPCSLSERQMGRGGGGPAATPTLDGNRLFTLSHEGQLFCLDADKGTVVWSKDVVKDFGGRPSHWDYAGSPLVEGDLLILDIGGKGASTIALDKTSGAVKWKSGDDSAGYASPVATTIDGKRAILVFKGEGLVALSATDGKEMWRHPWTTSYGVNAATPIVNGDTVFVSSGYNTGATLLQMKADSATALWKNKNMCNQTDSSVLYDGHAYGFSGDVNGGGKLRCIDLAKGEVKWTQDGLGTGTLIVADGKLIVLSEKGELLVAPATPEGFKPLSRAQVLKSKCWVEPVLCQGRIYCRDNQGDLVCLDVSGK